MVWGWAAGLRWCLALVWVAANVWLACCCSSRPIIGMNEHWTTLSHGAPVGWSTGGHPAREFRDIRLLAVTTATGWTRPRAGFTQMFQHLSKGSMHRPHQALLFFSAERGATVACQKSGIYPRFDSAAGLG